MNGTLLLSLYCCLLLQSNTSFYVRSYECFSLRTWIAIRKQVTPATALTGDEKKLSQRNLCATQQTVPLYLCIHEQNTIVMNCYYVKISVRTTKYNNWNGKTTIHCGYSETAKHVFIQLHNKLIMIFRILSPHGTSQNTSLWSSFASAITLEWKMSACPACIRAYWCVCVCVKMRGCDRLCWNYADRLVACFPHI